MRLVKVGVWLLGAIALFLLARHFGFGNGSSYIQFVDGAVLVYGAGEYIEKRPRIKRFIERHHDMHRRLNEIQTQHSDLIDVVKKHVEGGSK